MNSEVSATGMKVTAQADTSLLIGQNSAPNEATTSFAETNANPLVPMTRLFGGSKPESLDKEYYMADLSSNLWVDSATGLVKENSTAAYKEADTTCYKDYIMYIATAGQPFTNATLAVEMTVKANENETLGNWTHKALTVDFKVAKIGSNAEDTRVWDGTTFTSATIATVNNYAANGLKNANIYTGALGVSGGADTLCVIARVYFDGAAVETTSGRAYVNSNDVNLEDMNIEFKFTATENKTQAG